MRRWLLVSALLFFPASLSADGLDDEIAMPQPIDVSKARDEIVTKIPTLADASSLTAISSYRADLQKFNSGVVAGFLSRINQICEDLNSVERKANKKWAKGDMTPNEHDDVLEAIAIERRQCSDQFAKTSRYFALYYEVLSIYRELDAESLKKLSECNSNDKCRNS